MGEPTFADRPAHIARVRDDRESVSTVSMLKSRRRPSSSSLHECSALQLVPIRLLTTYVWLLAYFPAHPSTSLSRKRSQPPLTLASVKGLPQLIPMSKQIVISRALGKNAMELTTEKVYFLTRRLTGSQNFTRKYLMLSSENASSAPLREHSRARCLAGSHS